jgi:hypothetical protein
MDWGVSEMPSDELMCRVPETVSCNQCDARAVICSEPDITVVRKHPYKPAKAHQPQVKPADPHKKQRRKMAAASRKRNRK